MNDEKITAFKELVESTKENAKYFSEDVPRVLDPGDILSYVSVSERNSYLIT